jgi:hypothetical protein
MRMAGTLQDLRAHIAGDRVLGKEQFMDLDCDGVLDQRDSPLFDEEWVRVDSVVKRTKRDGRLSEEVWQLIEEIR